MKPEAGHPARYLLVLGVEQAIGVVVGALLGRSIGMLLAFDALARAGHGNSGVAGSLPIGLGGGAGLRFASARHRRKCGAPRS